MLVTSIDTAIRTIQSVEDAILAAEIPRVGGDD